MCPPWGVTVQLSTCAPAGTAPLQASGLSRAAAQSLSATSTAYSSIAVITTPAQGSTACASSGPGAAGRHLLAAEPDLDAAPEEASGYWLAMQTTGLGEDGSRSLQSLGVMAGSTGGSARQLTQVGSPAMATGSQSFSPEHYQVWPCASQCQSAMPGSSVETHEGPCTCTYAPRGQRTREPLLQQPQRDGPADSASAWNAGRQALKTLCICSCISGGWRIC